MRNKKTELIKNTLIIALGKMSTQFLTFLLLPVYTSKISSAEYGNIDLIISYSTFLIPIITIQQEFAVFRFLIDARGDDRKVAGIISTGVFNMLKLLLPFSIIATPILFLLKIKFAEWIILNILATATLSFFLQVSRGVGESLKYSVTSILTGMINVGLNLFFIFGLNLGGEAILIASVISSIIGVCYLIGLLRLTDKIAKAFVEKDIKKMLIRYSLPVMLNGVAWWVVNASDRTIMAYFVSLSAVGVYAAANTFASVVNGLFYIFSMSWSESASMHLKSKDAEGYFSDVFNSMVKIFTFICSALIFALPIAFRFLIKQDYRESYNYIPLLVLGALICGIANYYSCIYSALLVPQKIMKTTLIAGIVNVLIDLVLVHFIGVYAAIISTIIAFSIMLVMRHLDIIKLIKITVSPLAVLYFATSFLSASIFFYIDNIWVKAAMVIFFLATSSIMAKDLAIMSLKIIKEKTKR